MGKNKIAFVILYYKAYEDTIECINSVLQLNSTSFETEIVVVDNDSKDGAIDKLRKQFENAHYIINDKNDGYARGNNIGIKYAKNVLNANFVVIINSDVIIKDKQFGEKIITIYKKEEFYVMGPQVIGVYDKKNQSPISNCDDQNINKLLMVNDLHYLAWKLNAINLIRKLRTPNNGDYVKRDIINKYECICHGCCLIFSPLFLKRWNGFDSNTFLYKEERILFYILHRLKCKTLYCEDIMVEHKGGISVKKAIGSQDRKRFLFIYSERHKALVEEKRVMSLSNEEIEKVLL